MLKDATGFWAMSLKEKPQPTLKGYNAWVFRRLLEAKQMGSGPLAEWIIDRWIEDNTELLARTYKIERDDFSTSRKVVSIDRGKRNGGG